MKFIVNRSKDSADTKWKGKSHDSVTLTEVK